MDKYPKIFINYRWEDVGTTAQVIHDNLIRFLPEGSLLPFLDKKMDKGNDIPAEIQKALEEANIVLALIGKQWFTIEEPINPFKKIRRLEAEQDWVRRELEMALAGNKKIIPVLCDHEYWPKPGEINDAFPESIRALANRACYKFSSEYVVRDIEHLVKSHLLPAHAAEKSATSMANADPLAHLPLPEKYFKTHDLPRTPFCGLKHFSDREAALFFGREHEITRLYEQISRHRLLLLYGASGAGKSSLLHAGLLPRLEGKFQCLYHRRDKSAGLTQIWPEELHQIERASLPGLLLLDQVEEMYTHFDERHRGEKIAFAELLKHHLQQNPRLKIILGFRKEFYTDLRNLLLDQELGEYGEFELRPLEAAAARKAITGLVGNKLNGFYKLQLESGLEERILADIFHDRNSSHTAPLLQVQLRRLWDIACKQCNASSDPVLFTVADYERIQLGNLEAFLQTQLAELEKEAFDLGDALRNGLALDLLHFYTTREATATAHPDSALRSRYDFSQQPIERLLQALKDLYLLYGLEIRGTEDWEKASRLSHDALAPLLRKWYNDSDSPGQLASRIIDSKKQEVEKMPQSERALFSQPDLDFIEKGLGGMPRISPEVEAHLSNSHAFYERQAADIRLKDNSIFDYLKNGAYQLLAQADHQEAIPALMTAADKGIRLDELEAASLELCWFFALAAQPEHLRQAQQILQRLPLCRQLPEGDLRNALSLDQPTHTLEALRTLRPDACHKLQLRYFPEMLPIEGGTFTMGPDKYFSYTEHEVEISNFKLARTPLTNYQYALYCAQTGYSKIKTHSPPWGRYGSHPLVLIEWYDALKYLKWLSEQLGHKEYYDINDKVTDSNNHQDNDYRKWLVTPIPGSSGFRLPTEAEWEYAARGGKQSGGLAFAGSDDLSEVGWFQGNAQGEGHPVADQTKKANELGLYDMSGNVWEWCWDWYDPNYYDTCQKEGTVKNPAGPQEGSFRVIRGGSWYNEKKHCTSAFRFRDNPFSRDNGIGFRVAQDFTR